MPLCFALLSMAIVDWVHIMVPYPSHTSSLSNHPLWFTVSRLGFSYIPEYTISLSLAR